jgi:hypothetical protein
MATLRAEALPNQGQRRGSASQSRRKGPTGHRDSISVGQDAGNFFSQTVPDVAPAKPGRKKFILCFDGTGKFSGFVEESVSDLCTGNKFSGTDADSNILKA